MTSEQEAIALELAADFDTFNKSVAHAHYKGIRARINLENATAFAQGSPAKYALILECVTRVDVDELKGATKQKVAP